MLKLLEFRRYLRQHEDRLLLILVLFFLSSVVGMLGAWGWAFMQCLLRAFEKLSSKEIDAGVVADADSGSGRNRKGSSGKFLIQRFCIASQK